MTGLKDTFIELADSMHESIFSDFMDKCLYIDTSGSVSATYNVNTGERTFVGDVYAIQNAKIFEYSEDERQKLMNINENDMKCNFRVKELSSVGIKIKAGGLIINRDLAVYSIENINTNGIMYKLRIRKQTDDGSATSYLDYFK